METVRTYETSVYSCEITRRSIPEGSKLHTRRRENLKSHRCGSYQQYISNKNKKVMDEPNLSPAGLYLGQIMALSLIWTPLTKSTFPRWTRHISPVQVRKRFEIKTSAAGHWTWVSRPVCSSCCHEGASNSSVNEFWLFTTIQRELRNVTTHDISVTLCALCTCNSALLVLIWMMPVTKNSNISADHKLWA
jgi:hypothetical protein